MKPTRTARTRSEPVEWPLCNEPILHLVRWRGPSLALPGSTCATIVWNGAGEGVAMGPRP